MTQMEPGLYNMDCMEAMKQFPDKFFDLAIVDPPYGGANSDIGGGRRFGQRFDRYKQDGQAAPGQVSTAKKSSRGTQPRSRSTLMNCFVFHASRSSGAGITSNCRRRGASLYGANYRSARAFQWLWQSMHGLRSTVTRKSLSIRRKETGMIGVSTQHKSQ